MRYAVALGFFDGVHIGHAALVRRAAELARERGGEAAVCTFDRSPSAAVSGRAERLINSADDRKWLLRELFGVEKVITLEFDEKLRALAPGAFVELLAHKFRADALVAGWNYRFGAGGRGDAALLTRECARLGLKCDILPAVEAHGDAVSSTRIRALIESGEMLAAQEFLGHRHILGGVVAHGRALGRTIGFPTVNLPIPEGVIAPRYGVYAVRVRVGGEVFGGVANVGEKPTVGGARAGVETNIFDFDRDIYGEHIVVEFGRFLRPEAKFANLGALKAQIAKDSAAAREAPDL